MVGEFGLETSAFCACDRFQQVACLKILGAGAFPWGPVLLVYIYLHLYE